MTTQALKNILLGKIALCETVRRHLADLKAYQDMMREQPELSMVDQMELVGSQRSIDHEIQAAEMKVSETRQTIIQSGMNLDDFSDERQREWALANLDGADLKMWLD
jgi:hypothetical protein